MVALGELQQIVPKAIQRLSEFGAVDGNSLVVTGDNNDVFYIEVVIEPHKPIPRPFTVDGLLFVVHEILTPIKDNLPAKL